MNDADWLRKRIKPPKAGCAPMVLLGLGVALAGLALIA